MFSEHLENILK